MLKPRLLTYISCVLDSIRRHTLFTGRIGVWSVVLSSIAFELLLIIDPLGPIMMTVINELLLATSGLLGAYACRQRSRREKGRPRTGWALIGLSCTSFGVSQILFALQSTIDQRVAESGSSFADVFAALAVPVAIAGLVLLVGRLSTTSRMLSLLDGLTITLSLAFISWAFVLGPVYRDRHGDTSARFTNLFYAGGTVALFVLVLVLAMRWRGDTITLTLFGAGYAWLTAANLAFALKSMHQTYATGDVWIDIGWFTPFLLFGLAATRPMTDDAEGTEQRRWFLTLFIPYASVLGMALGCLVLFVHGPKFDVFLQFVGVTVIVIALARQLVTLIEHRRLNVELEERVIERSAAAMRSEARLSSLLSNSSDVIAVLDPIGYLRYASPAIETVFGVGPAAATGHPMLDFVHEDERSYVAATLTRVADHDLSALTVSCRVRGADGAYRQVEATATALHDYALGEGVILNIRDVTERAALQAELQRQATYDQLTTLANRRLFNERLDHALKRSRRNGECVSVLFIDLDHFKRVNDSTGHASGDEILIQVAERLTRCLRPADTAARLGGDEFAVLLEDTDAAGAELVATRIIDTLTPPFQLGDRRVSVSASIGVATSESGSAEVDVLLRDADVAMYQAKASGRGRFALFHPNMHRRIAEQMELESDLRHAIERAELRVVYQPIIDLNTHEVLGVEALLRWRRSDNVDVPPSLFIPIAEEAGLIPTLDHWVLLAACQQGVEWQRRYPRHGALRVNVNMSALEFTNTDIVTTVSDVLAETGINAAHLVLEITETAILPDLPGLDDIVGQLRGLGVGISLDDFGTGYSSLAALRRFPLDEIKLDRSFVHSIERSASGRNLVQSIISMALALDLHTVAEGVETVDQMDLLRALGCRTGQGYLISPPMPALALEHLFASSLVGIVPAHLEVERADQEPVGGAASRRHKAPLGGVGNVAMAPLDAGQVVSTTDRVRARG